MRYPCSYNIPFHFIGKENAVFKALKKVPNANVYWKEDIPRNYYYTYNERILQLVLIMDEGYEACCPNGETPPDTSKHKIALSEEFGKIPGRNERSF